MLTMIIQKDDTDNNSEYDGDSDTETPKNILEKCKET